MALLRAAKVLQTLKLEGEEHLVVQRVKDMTDDDGFNAQTEQYENLVRAA